MIQRIQSVLMLISGGVLGMEFIFPFATSSSQKSGFLSDMIYNISDSPVLLGTSIAGIVLCIIAIFLFKNRKLQKTISWVAMVICIMIPVLAYVLFSQNQSEISEDISLGAGTFLPIVSAILLAIANRFINKDENLVKSMDRLR